MNAGRSKQFTTGKIIPLIFCFLCCATVSCSNDIKDIEALTGGKPNLNVDKAEHIVAIFSRDGKFKFKVYAREFVRNSSAKPSFIDLNRDLKIEFFNDSTGEVDNILTADSCRYYDVQAHRRTSQ